MALGISAEPVATSRSEKVFRPLLVTVWATWLRARLVQPSIRLMRRISRRLRASIPWSATGASSSSSIALSRSRSFMGSYHRVLSVSTCIAGNGRDAATHLLTRLHQHLNGTVWHQHVGAGTELNHAKLLPGAELFARTRPADNAPRDQPSELHDGDFA